MKDYNKFQWSIFNGPSRNEQYVVRGDDFEDFQKDIAKVRKLLGSEDIAENVICPVHKVALKHYQNDKGEWWSHQLPGGSYCNGRDNLKNRANKEDEKHDKKVSEF